ncbi:MAG: hypothetical protein LBL08_03425, partial [Candidatus Nomurabacteria bacterium]|nr:hypothetical protein [Candidatus Nomurabacteria bacterium]
DAVNHEFCYLEVADTIKIKYLTSDSREHAIASKFEISDIQKQEQENQFQFMQILPFVFPLFFIVIVFIIIIAAIRQRKNADFDGDGLANDNKPATAEQKKLIQEGFRQLGIHHEAKRGLTQAQARETLREIDRKLKRK